MTDTTIQALAAANDEINRQYGLTRKLRPDLTTEELERFEKYGAIEFKSAGTTRKR